MNIFCKCSTVNISKHTFLLVICIAKNFIWTTLKIFLHPQIPDCQILSHHNKPYINGNPIYSAFRWCITLNFTNWTLVTGFVVQAGSHVWSKLKRHDVTPARGEQRVNSGPCPCQRGSILTPSSNNPVHRWATHLSLHAINLALRAEQQQEPLQKDVGACSGLRAAIFNIKARLSCETRCLQSS